jgi:hypothetical protein
MIVPDNSSKGWFFVKSVQTESGRHQDIEVAAYYLWQQRGCPLGEPEVDWLRAEEQLDQPNNPLLLASKAVGSALGSVAGALASVGSLIQSAVNPESE